MTFDLDLDLDLGLTITEEEAMNQIIATKKEAEMERECCSFYYIIRDKHGDNVTIVKYDLDLPTPAQNQQP